MNLLGVPSGLLIASIFSTEPTLVVPGKRLLPRIIKVGHMKIGYNIRTSTSATFASERLGV